MTLSTGGHYPPLSLTLPSCPVGRLLLISFHRVVVRIKHSSDHARKGSCLPLCSNSGIKPLRAYERNTRATWARSLNQPHLIHTTWGTVCKLGAEGFEASSAMSSLAPPTFLSLNFLTEGLEMGG